MCVRRSKDLLALVFDTHGTMLQVLMMEDESRAAAFIAKGLREQTYAVDVAADGEEALYQASVNEYDLVVLDIMLPLKDGHSVCRERRNSGFRAPIFMTAYDAVANRVAGLDSGADDHLTRPFDFKELPARLRALARRSVVLRPEAIRIPDLTLDTASRQATQAGRPMSLTAKEYALLEFLMLNDHRLKAGGLGPAAESRLKGVAVAVVVPASWPQTTSVTEAPKTRAQAAITKLRTLPRKQR
jgi:DNA-binding response OmpR family regulator